MPGGYLTLRQAELLFEDHASLYSLASRHGATERGVRNLGRPRPVVCTNTTPGRMGTCGVARRRLSGQRIYGHEPLGGWCGRHLIGGSLGPASAAVGADPLATLVLKGEKQWDASRDCLNRPT